MSNILVLGDIQVSALDIETCSAFIQEQAPNLNIADTILRARGISELKAFVQSQRRLQARCQDIDVISQMPIDVMRRIVIERFCFDAVNLGSYLTHNIDDRDAFREVMVIFTMSSMQGLPRPDAALRGYDDIPARNPMTNEQLTLSQLTRLQTQLDLILKAHEWIVKNILQTDPRELYRSV